ncbi:MAG: L,D-transpeptidase family protein [Coriobacteriia bacterium]|nr:L,D-transpeptidase family protein [Coriobacteriia bacterium]
MSRRDSRLVFLIVLGFALALSSAPAALGAWPGGVQQVAVPTERIVGADVFDSAVLVGARQYPGWAGVEHVVVASGEPAALADAAIAQSLCWAYDAPLLLVKSTSVPAATRVALQQIASVNPGLTVHVVGSSSTIRAASLAQVQSAASTATVEQPWKTVTRSSLAAAVAGRTREVAAATSRSIPAVALVANTGDNPELVWDAIVASAISRHTGIPLLVTGSRTVPLATSSALSAAGFPRVVVIGGTRSISSGAYGQLHASERWGGANLSSTAAIVGSKSTSLGYSSIATVGVAAVQGHAAVGAGLVGSQGGVMLFSGKARVARPTWSLLAANSGALSQAYVFGGGSIDEAQVRELRGDAARPWLASDAPGRYVAKRFRVTGWVGGNTTSISIKVDGKRVAGATLAPWQRFNFTAIPMSGSSARVEVVAENPDGRDTASGRTVKRLRYPAATCIVIDKSDFKLYWVKDNRLVKAYPIAIGRAGMETPAPATWKILAKYHTSPGSVYGPRKMRLFRQRGGHYSFTAYGIHGTNQEWVIGTKASHGCIRMYNRDVLKLFPQVPMGTLVFTRQ